MAAKLTKEQKLVRIEEERAALLKQIEEEKAAAHQTLAQELAANEVKINELDLAEAKEIEMVKARFTGKRDKLIARDLEIEEALAEQSDVISAGA